VEADHVSRSDGLKHLPGDLIRRLEPPVLGDHGGHDHPFTGLAGDARDPLRIAQVGRADQGRPEARGALDRTSGPLQLEAERFVVQLFCGGVAPQMVTQLVPATRQPCRDLGPLLDRLATKEEGRPTLARLDRVGDCEGPPRGPIVEAEGDSRTRVGGTR
jgi:hypothetical protein